MVSLPQEEATVGRLSDNVIAIDDRSVSRRHAVISPVGEGHALRDLGSKNGTWLNDRRLGSSPAQLHTGDQIALGRFGVSIGYYANEATVTEAAGVALPAWIGALALSEPWTESKRWLGIVRVTPWLRLLGAAIGVAAGSLALVWWIIRFLDG